MAERLDQERQEVTKGDVRIEKEGVGTFTIIYQHHLFSQVDPERIPNDVTSIFLESPHFDWWDQPDIALKKAAKTNKAYGKVLERFTSIPLYTGDPYLPHHLTYAATEIFVVGCETIIGMRLLKKHAPLLAQKLFKHNEAEETRRQFLAKTWRVLGAGIGAWAVLPAISSIARYSVAELLPATERPTAAFQKFSHTLHPEQFPINTIFRDVVVAHKMEWVAKRQGGHPHIAYLAGPCHVNIEEFLKDSPDDRIAFLRRWVPEGTMSERFFGLLELRHRKGEEGKEDKEQQWHVTQKMEIPDLKNLALNASHG